MQSVSLFSAYPRHTIHSQKDLAKRQPAAKGVDSVQFSGAAQVDSPSSAQKFETILSRMFPNTTTMSPRDYEQASKRMGELATNIFHQFNIMPINSSAGALIFETEDGLVFLAEEESQQYLAKGEFPATALKINNTYPKSTRELLIDILNNPEVLIRTDGFGPDEPVFILTGQHYQAAIADTPADMMPPILSAEASLQQYERIKTIAFIRNPFTS